MTNTRGLTLIFAASVALSTPAFAQQTKTQQACINAINKDAALVGKTQGKENIACVKRSIKETVASNCPTEDFKLKVAARLGKVLSDNTEKCSETPDFAYSMSAGDAYKNAELGLLADVFGSTDVDAPVSSDKTIGACQYGVIKGVEKLAFTISQAFVHCKDGALKGGAVTAMDVQACVGSDAKNKVSGAATKLAATVTARCGSVAISSAFPGACSASPSLAACLTARAKCRMCQAANTADALSAPCDTIDDSMANASCS